MPRSGFGRRSISADRVLGADLVRRDVPVLWRPTNGALRSGPVRQPNVVVATAVVADIPRPPRRPSGGRHGRIGNVAEPLAMGPSVPGWVCAGALPSPGGHGHVAGGVASVADVNTKSGCGDFADVTHRQSLALSEAGTPTERKARQISDAVPLLTEHARGKATKTVLLAPT